jgi:branched-chain amino acid transport system substrate-binding protein
VALASQALLSGSQDPCDEQRTGSLITQQFKDQPENYIFAMLPTTVFRSHDCGRGIARRGFKKSRHPGRLHQLRPTRSCDLNRFEGHSITPVAVEKLNIKDVDMTAQLLKAKEAGAEAILTHGIVPELPDRQWHDRWAESRWSAAGRCRWPTTSTTPALAEKAPYAANLHPGSRPRPSVSPSSSIPENLQPKNQRIGLPVSAAQGYDSIYLLAAAIS